jgi:hypothetical protein
MSSWTVSRGIGARAVCRSRLFYAFLGSASCVLPSPCASRCRRSVGEFGIAVRGGNLCWRVHGRCGLFSCALPMPFSSHPVRNVAGCGIAACAGNLCWRVREPRGLSSCVLPRPCASRYRRSVGGCGMETSFWNANHAIAGRAGNLGRIVRGLAQCVAQGPFAVLPARAAAWHEMSRVCRNPSIARRGRFCRGRVPGRRWKILPCRQLGKTC